MGGENQCQHFNKIIKQNAVNTSSGGGGNTEFPEDSPFNLTAVWNDLRNPIKHVPIGSSLSFNTNRFSVSADNSNWWCEDAFKNTVNSPMGGIMLIPYNADVLGRYAILYNRTEAGECTTERTALAYNILPERLRGINCKFTGAVYAPDGNVYATPGCLNCILKIQHPTWVNGVLTDNPSFETIGEDVLSITDYVKWNGAVVTPSGDIYAMPAGATSVLKFNVYTQRITFLGTFPNTTRKYKAAQLDHTGRYIYATKDINAPSDLTIDTYTDELTYNADGTPNGNEYFMPPIEIDYPNVYWSYLNTCERVTKPFNAAVSIEGGYSGTTTTNVAAKYTFSSGALGWCGVHYFIPEDESGTTTHTIIRKLVYGDPTTVASDLSSRKKVGAINVSAFSGLASTQCAHHTGTILAPDGRVYTFPRNLTELGAYIYGVRVSSTITNGTTPVPFYNPATVLSPLLNHN